MKRIFLTAISIALLLNLKAFAQIPNPGLENWTPVTSYNEPDGWKTGNEYSTQLFQGITAYDTTAFHSQTKAMVLKTQGSFHFPGVAVTGTIAVVGTSSFTIGGGFPWTFKSVKLSGFYEYTSGNGVDSAFVKVIFFKRNGSNRDTIAVGSKGLSGASSYTQFDVFLNYRDFITHPDSALIIIQSSKNLLSAQAGSMMLVDDLVFAGDNTGVNNLNTVPCLISAYPNPASEIINFAISNISNAKTLSVFDLLGKKIKSIEITSAQLSVSTVGLNNSLYFYQVADRNNNIISTGKFSIKK